MGVLSGQASGWVPAEPGENYPRAGLEPELASFPLNRHRLSVKILETSDLSKSISGRAGGWSFPFCKCFNPFHTILDNILTTTTKRRSVFKEHERKLIGSPLDCLRAEEILSPDVSCITCSVPSLRSLSLEGGEGLKGESRGAWSKGREWGRSGRPNSIFLHISCEGLHLTALQQSACWVSGGV